MNWYKTAKDFKDRNVINEKIRYLEELGIILTYASKLIFQSSTLAKESNYQVLTNKKISSYPLLCEILSQADAIALDNPWKFASLCQEATENIGNYIYKLKKERDEFTYGDGKKNKPKKGLV